MGTSNAHQYHINGSVFKGITGPLFKTLRQLRNIRPNMECLLSEVAVYPNAHASLKSYKLDVLFQGQPRPDKGYETWVFPQMPFRSARPFGP